jgi:hypothetical protein
MQYKKIGMNYDKRRKKIFITADDYLSPDRSSELERFNKCGGKIVITSYDVQTKKSKTTIQFVKPLAID